MSEQQTIETETAAGADAESARGVASGNGPGGAVTASERGAVAEILRIAAPSVATMASYTVMQFVDGLMVARITPHDPMNLAAQGNGGLAAWIPMSVVAGTTAVVNTYVAQHLGAGTPRAGPAYAWNGLWLALLAAALMIPYAVVLPSIMSAAGHDPRLIPLECEYARILIAGAFFSMATRAISQYFYGMHRPGVVLGAALAGNAVNLLGNYALIFGAWGAPALGLTGAAIATVLGSVVELAIPMWVFLSKRAHAAYGTRDAWRPSKRHLRDIVRLGWPGGLMFGNEMVCWGYFMIFLVGRFGSDHSAASLIAQRYMHISFMPAVGISFAMTAVVGRCLGAGRPDLARSRARAGLGLSVVYMTLCAGTFLVFRDSMAHAFTDDPRVLAIARTLIVVAALFQLFDALGITIIGILRGAGDTVWPGVATVVLSWACIVGLGHLFAWARPEWESVGPWIGCAAYITALGLVLFHRFARGDWAARKVVGTPAAGH